MRQFYLVGAIIPESLRWSSNTGRKVNRGTKTYTMNVSLDGSERTNIKECTWR
jgi:hypothetical protein